MAAHLAHVAGVSWAVWVPHTLWAAASDGVRLGDEAGLTPADGVTWGYFTHSDIHKTNYDYGKLSSEYS